MAKVIGVQPKEDIGKGLLSSGLQMGGQALGSAYGGPVGGAIGGQLGATAGKAVNSGSNQGPSGIEQATSPVDRRMQATQQEPLNQLKEGRAALSSMDPDTQAALSPVLDEAIKKAATQKQQTNGGY